MASSTLGRIRTVSDSLAQVNKIGVARRKTNLTRDLGAATAKQEFYGGILKTFEGAETTPSRW